MARHAIPRRVVSTGEGFRITELARALGTTVRALRYYEQIGLIRPDRARGNARVYGPDMRRRAGVVVRLRQAGVAADEIFDILERGADSVFNQLLADKLRARMHSLDVQRARIAATLEGLS